VPPSSARTATGRERAAGEQCRAPATQADSAAAADAAWQAPCRRECGGFASRADAAAARRLRGRLRTADDRVGAGDGLELVAERRRRRPAVRQRLSPVPVAEKAFGRAPAGRAKAGDRPGHEARSTPPIPPRLAGGPDAVHARPLPRVEDHGVARRLAAEETWQLEVSARGRSAGDQSHSHSHSRGRRSRARARLVATRDLAHPRAPTVRHAAIDAALSQALGSCRGRARERRRRPRARERRLLEDPTTRAPARASPAPTRGAGAGAGHDDAEAVETGAGLTSAWRRPRHHAGSVQPGNGRKSSRAPVATTRRSNATRIGRPCRSTSSSPGRVTSTTVARSSLATPECARRSSHARAPAKAPAPDLAPTGLLVEETCVRPPPPRGRPPQSPPPAAHDDDVARGGALGGASVQPGSDGSWFASVQPSPERRHGTPLW